MSKVVIWSDLHLGHDNAINWRRKFNTPEEHHETLFEALATAVNKRDVLYLLGDIAMSIEWLDRVASIPAIKKIAILGNHDTETERWGVSAKDLTDRFDEVHGLLKKRTPKGLHNVWMSHAPVHVQELRGCVNVHGHTHGHVISVDGGRYDGRADDRYINLCPEQTDWKPVTLQDLYKKLRV